MCNLSYSHLYNERDVTSFLCSLKQIKHYKPSAPGVHFNKYETIMHQSNLFFDLLDPVTCFYVAKIPLGLQSSHTMAAAQFYLDPWLLVTVGAPAQN